MLPLHLAVRIWVSVTSPEPGTFEQSVDDGRTWSSLCSLPCEATVLAAPNVRHRVVTEHDDIPVVVSGEDGDHVDLVARPASRLKDPLLVTAIGLGGLSVLALGAAVTLPKDGYEDEKRSESLASMGAMLVVSSLVLVFAAFQQPKSGFESWITEGPK